MFNGEVKGVKKETLLGKMLGTNCSILDNLRGFRHHFAILGLDHFNDDALLALANPAVAIATTRAVTATTVSA